MSTIWIALLLGFAAAAQGAALDDEFLAAREAYRAGNAARLEKHAARLTGHLLEPYVAYWQLALRLERASAEDVRAYLVQRARESTQASRAN